ncbi:hypothetical protein YN1HA_19790 [Sulfurisphaera ohwakuensis]
MEIIIKTKAKAKPFTPLLIPLSNLFPFSSLYSTNVEINNKDKAKITRVSKRVVIKVMDTRNGILAATLPIKPVNSSQLHERAVAISPNDERICELAFTFIVIYKVR